MTIEADGYETMRLDAPQFGVPIAAADELGFELLIAFDDPEGQAGLLLLGRLGKPISEAPKFREFRDIAPGRALFSLPNSIFRASARGANAPVPQSAPSPGCLAYTDKGIFICIEGHNGSVGGLNLETGHFVSRVPRLGRFYTAWEIVRRLASGDLVVASVIQGDR